MSRQEQGSVVDQSFQTGCFHSSEAALSYIVGPPNELPLVLIHGTASRWQPFQSILPALAQKYHVYALDLRGHGRSSHTPGAYRLEDYTRDIHQFIDHQVQAPAVVYGHSLGALVGINLAAQQPQRVRALILGDPPLFYHDTRITDIFWHSAFVELLEFMRVHPDPTEMEAWLTQNMPGMSPDRRSERVHSLERLDPEVVRAVISDKLMAGISLPSLVPRVTCPVLLLRGNPSLGSALREQDVDFATSHFPKIRVLEMENIGHGIIPASQLAQVIEFIDTLTEITEATKLLR
jgi:pimeloyl-ACP methyl ester carboxylesterase